MRELSAEALAGHTASRSLEALNFAGVAEVCRASSAAHAPLPDVAAALRQALPR